MLCADDPNRGMVIREGLAPLGFATDFAYTPVDAIARATATPYGAFVVDLDLPDGESAGLIRDLRNLPLPRSETPIIGMTADARHEHEGDRD